MHGEGSIKNSPTTELRRGLDGKHHWFAVASPNTDADVSLPLNDWVESRNNSLTSQTNEMNDRLKRQRAAANNEIGAELLIGILDQDWEFTSKDEQAKFRDSVRLTVQAAGHDEHTIEDMVTWATNAAEIPDNGDGNRWWDRATVRTTTSVRSTLASRPADYLTEQARHVFTVLTSSIVDKYASVDLDDQDTFNEFAAETYMAITGAGHTHDLATKGIKWAHSAVREGSVAIRGAVEEPMFSEKFANLVLANCTTADVLNPEAQATMRATVRRELIKDGHTLATAKRGAEWATRETAVRAEAG
jgi:hypothetical protein